MRQQGHEVVCPDLPGHGRDRTPLSEVTLQTYVDQVCELLDAAAEPVILVGHSMGGAVITQTAEQQPDKIAKLIYLAAFLLQDGQSCLDLAKADKEALYLPNVALSRDKRIARLREECLRTVLYADCSEEDVELARMLLTPQACAPLSTPVRTTRQNYGGIMRTYVECTLDKVISVGTQRAMRSRLPCESVFSMQSSHSPFFSSPTALVRCLTES